MTRKEKLLLSQSIQAARRTKDQALAMKERGEVSAAVYHRAAGAYDAPQELAHLMENT